MSKVSIKVCASCHWWEAPEATGTPARAPCRFNPPAAEGLRTAMVADLAVGVWPTTLATDRCAKFWWNAAEAPKHGAVSPI